MALHGDNRENTSGRLPRPTRRSGRPDELADAITFLNTNPYMTRLTLVVDGGYLGIARYGRIH
jgi:NAD(P)-dependent dehydrogenase (short-subunit alcohol dehydrogenase family)